MSRALITLIRDNGLCPCPLCKIKRPDIKNLGTKVQARQLTKNQRVDDTRRCRRVQAARSQVYSAKGGALNSRNVERLLAEESLVPTEVWIQTKLNNSAITTSDKRSQNAFSNKLRLAGFDFHEMIVPDVMHETLLGTWKALLLIVIRLLFALHPKKGVAELDAR